MKRQQARKRPEKRITAPRVIVLVVAAVMIILGGFFAAGAVRVAMQKAQFKRADKHVTLLQSKLTQALGLPTSIKSLTGCTRSSAKFEQGRLYCTVGRTLSYTGDSNSVANIVSKAQSTFEQVWQITYMGDSPFNSEKLPDPAHLGQDYMDNDAHLACSVGYDYSTAKGMLKITFTCATQARAAFYTIKNS